MNPPPPWFHWSLRPSAFILINWIVFPMGILIIKKSPDSGLPRSAKLSPDYHFIGQIKSRSTASAQLSAYAHWLQTHRQILLTGNHSSLLQTCGIALCRTRQSRAPNIDRCAPEIWSQPFRLTLTLTPAFDLDPRPLTLTLKQCNSDAKRQFLTFDLDLWPTTLTYIPSLA